MITLGIETSCDETSCAILENGGSILSNITSSSFKKHQPYGGIVPEIASRHSLEQIHFVLREVLREARKKLSEIDLIAVTCGPGLIGSLLVGISFARAMAFARKMDLIGVNHLEAHLEANFIGRRWTKEPFLGLVVSGGHTLLVLHHHGKYRRLGETVDDAIGEAYDKVAKLMGLGYPGGPILDRLAKDGNPHRFRFTKPKMDDELDFSFSGIKTAILHLVQDLKNDLKKETSNLAASFQQAVISWLIEGVRKACLKTGVKTVLVGGGVSANSLLRSRLVEMTREMNLSILIPPLPLTNDNAAMIAKSGYERFRRGIRSDLALEAQANLRIG